MTILNLMLGRKRGGLEQAALDYAEALALAHIPALTVISPHAWIEAPLTLAGMAHQSLRNFGYWDPLAAYHFRRLAAKTKATAVICHGHRAQGIAMRAVHGRIPVIAVSHNYKTRRVLGADHNFAITNHVANHLTQSGATKISLMPNMVRVGPAPARGPFRTPPVIGAMGRLVAKKGFDTFLDALALLHQRGVPFRAVIGGDGDQKPLLETRIAQYGLTGIVTLSGWVKDKAAFFEQVDLFVLPSHHEPFGIVLIEAMAHAMPIVTSDAEGPSEIVHPGADALLVPKGNPEALADALAELLNDAPRAAKLGQTAHALVTAEYGMDRMAARLQTALASYIAPYGN